jgi:cytochrome c-type biogenesis protein CcmH/NrfG
MLSSRNIHFAILGIILGATAGYVLAFYQAAAAAPPPAAESAVHGSSTGAGADSGGLPSNHPEVNDEQMLALLKKAAEESPTQPEVLSRYANELFQVGRIEESAQWYSKVVALEPKNTDVRSLYGAVLWRIGKKAEAKTQLQTALVQDPKHVPSLHGLFIIAIANNDVANAAEIIHKIEEVEPGYPSLPDLKKRLAAEKSKSSK